MHRMKKTESNRLAELEERIVELEIRFTHQARQLEELNEVLTESADFIALLRQENNTFRQMLKGLSPDMLESPDE
jgi:SlyX protein